MNKPITLEEMTAYINATWKKCQSEAWGEPVAWMNRHGACMSAVFKEVDATAGEYTTPLYTAPPQRKPLSDEEIQALWEKAFDSGSSPRDFARAIEAAHGIKE